MIDELAKDKLNQSLRTFLLKLQIDNHLTDPQMIEILKDQEVYFKLIWHIHKEDSD